MSHGFWLSDAQWNRLAPLLPNKPRGVARVDDRRVTSGIEVALQSGGRWIDVPAEYGPRKTLYNHFVRWSAQGVWQTVFEALAAAGDVGHGPFDRLRPECKPMAFDAPYRPE